MSIGKVRSYFAQFGKEADILEFDTSSATVELAAQTVGVEAARIAKTLSFDAEDGCLLLVCAGDARIDNAKFRHRFHTKARMLTPEAVEEFTGHAVGGVCPFGIDNEAVHTYLDQSLRRFDTVFPAAGSSNSAIELNMDELARFSNCVEWVDVCKNWREETSK